jgi:hypothetical protein
MGLLENFFGRRNEKWPVLLLNFIPTPPFEALSEQYWN